MTGAAASTGGPVLLVGECGVPTGFARVLESLSGSLPPEWTPHVVDASAPARALEDALARVRPRVVLAVDELANAARHRALLDPGRGFAAVLYATVDRPQPMPPALAELDGIVAFTGYGRRVIDAGLRRLGSARPPVHVIPPGVDTAVFRPLADDPAAARRSARARLFPDRPELQDAFVVLNANRNQPAKRVDLTLEGFARFARGKPPGVRLYLHMATRARAAGETALVDRWGIRERVLGACTGASHPALASDALNVLYNACDVGVNTSEGEGFGLVAFEHAAAGAPQVVPRHGACAELWAGAAELLPPERRAPAEGFLKPGRTVSASALADALERLYGDPGHRARMASAAYARATRPDHRWPHVGRAWGGVLHAVASERRLP